MLLHTGRSSVLRAASHKSPSSLLVLSTHRPVVKFDPVAFSQRHVCAAAQAQVQIPAAVPVHPEIGEVLFSETDLHTVVARLGR